MRTFSYKAPLLVVAGPPGHADHLTIAEIAQRLAMDEWAPLDLDGGLIQLDTCGPVDVDTLVTRLLPLL